METPAPGDFLVDLLLQLPVVYLVKMHNQQLVMEQYGCLAVHQELLVASFLQSSALLLALAAHLVKLLNLGVHCLVEQEFKVLRTQFLVEVEPLLPPACLVVEHQLRQDQFLVELLAKCLVLVEQFLGELQAKLQALVDQCLEEAVCLAQHLASQLLDHLQLHVDQEAAYLAPEFELGNVPTRPPPKEWCFLESWIGGMK